MCQHFTIKHTNAEIFKILVDASTYIFDDALVAACTHGRTDLVRLLLPHTDPTKFNHAFLRRALSCENHDVIRVLLADPRVISCTTVMVSIFQDQLYKLDLGSSDEIVKLAPVVAKMAPVVAKLVHAATLEYKNRQKLFVF